MTQKDIERLEQHAYNIRKHVLEMTTAAGSGHVGGALSSADIFTILFFNILRQKLDNPHWEQRDRFILSAGHICPAYYAALAEAGYIDIDKLETFRQVGSPLQGHPGHVELPLIETSSGSLGHGLSIALGKALALRVKRIDARVYCLMSDGEQEEGSTWEAAMAAHHYHADNLIAIIDRNGLQIGGSTESTISLAPIKQKYIAFGWHVIETDGHNFAQLSKALIEAQETKNRPCLVIAHTTMGEGVPSIENNYHWHGKAFSKSELPKAIDELNKKYGRELVTGNNNG